MPVDPKRCLFLHPLAAYNSTLTQAAIMSPAQPDSGIDQLLHAETELLPPKSLVENARLRNYEDEYRRSVENPEIFWALAAKELEWFQTWTKIFEWQYPTF